MVTHGNGGWTSHRAAHRRRGEWGTKFRALTKDQYIAAFPDRAASPKEIDKEDKDDSSIDL